MVICACLCLCALQSNEKGRRLTLIGGLGEKTLKKRKEQKKIKHLPHPRAGTRARQPRRIPLPVDDPTSLARRAQVDCKCPIDSESKQSETFMASTA
eukprot:m.337833 g.337833  ORF g.337833 m.337833 type:complete len:97 (+) comp19807_c0_seq13:2375-2665(+)